MFPSSRAFAALFLTITFGLIGCQAPYYYLDTYEGKIDHPEVDVVPDAKTAIEVAAVILKSIFGDQAIEKQKPFKATLDRGVWVVEGNFPADGKSVGGSSYIGIQKKDGKVIFWNHAV